MKVSASAGNDAASAAYACPYPMAPRHGSMCGGPREPFSIAGTAGGRSGRGQSARCDRAGAIGFRETRLLDEALERSSLTVVRASRMRRRPHRYVGELTLDAHQRF